jgi:hypothetical protein
MSRLVDWGRWLVSAFFAVIAAVMIWYALGATPRYAVSDPHQVRYHFLSSALGCGLLAVCAWGVFQWRIWGHVLALTICILTILLDVLFMIAYGTFALNAGLAVPILITAWLLLPSVRAAYWHGERLA